ncbi:hypothetical protein AT15_01560 [Kosmotoga arenicorallina S304]|uniref:Methyltransferase domain-containing protein n=1 Tax=Kosmotoga arenicorallina S304 TaxID=1453497 RepID=A0A176K005_9BACT|nr:methyltransferase domain-containing protein [Kosmotoga arenicorallina]OAA29748.1 hypothetical protein AT15_01560 [Kosmotoga arenicorallina S304]
MQKNFDPSPIKDLKFDQKLPEGRTNHATVVLALYSKVPRNVKKILELGSGSGVVSIFLAHAYGCEVVGIEKSDILVSIANRNAETNGVKKHVRFVNCSVEETPEHFQPESFDMVVSNPPHFLHEGKRSPYSERNSWRRLDDKTARNFVETARKMLKNRGIFYFLLHPRDLIRWIKILESVKFGVHRLLPIYGSFNGQARLVLISGRKNSSSELVIESPLILNKEEK